MATIDSGARWPARAGSAGELVDVPVSEDDVLEVALTAARRGDDAGFLVLYRALQPRLLRYLKVRTTDSADDVAGETWLQVVRDLGRFRGNVDAFRAWVFTVARNRAVDAARAARARPLITVADVSTIQVSDLAPSAETQALEKMSTDQALRLVATLSPEVAEMVALRVIAGLDATAVADIVGKSAGAVRVAVHRALAQLSGRPGVSPQEVIS